MAALAVWSSPLFDGIRPMVLLGVLTPIAVAGILALAIGRFGLVSN